MGVIGWPAPALLEGGEEEKRERKLYMVPDIQSRALFLQFGVPLLDDKHATSVGCHSRVLFLRKGILQ